MSSVEFLLNVASGKICELMALLGDEECLADDSIQPVTRDKALRSTCMALVEQSITKGQPHDDEILAFLITHQLTTLQPFISGILMAARDSAPATLAYAEAIESCMSD